MTNISELVWGTIDRDINLRISLDRDFVNIRALAKHIINEISSKYPALRHKLTIDAVISSIRRYGKDTKFQIAVENAKKAAVGTSISTKSNVVVIALEKARPVQKLLPQLFSVIDYSKNEILRVSQADECIKIIVDEKNLQKIIDIVPKEFIIKTKKNLAEINLRVDESSFNTPGVIAMITSELFLHQVNIVEMVTLIPEIVIIVENHQLLDSYEAVCNLTSSCNKVIKN